MSVITTTVTTQFQPSVAEPYETYHSTSLRITSAVSELDDESACAIDYDSLNIGFTSQYDLLKTQSGDFRYVTPTNGGLYFDVSYYHFELQKVIFLGRFTDPRVASLAHAIARSNTTVRAVDNAAQEYIESMLPSVTASTSVQFSTASTTFSTSSTSRPQSSTQSSTQAMSSSALHADNLF